MGFASGIFFLPGMAIYDDLAVTAIGLKRARNGQFARRHEDWSGIVITFRGSTHFGHFDDFWHYLDALLTPF